MNGIEKENFIDIKEMFKEINSLITKFQNDPNKQGLESFKSMLYYIKEEIKCMVDGVSIASRDQKLEHLENSNKVLNIIIYQRLDKENGFYNDMEKTIEIIKGRVSKIHYSLLSCNMNITPQSNPIKESKEAEKAYKEIENMIESVEILYSQKSQVNNDRVSTKNKIFRFFHWLGEKLGITKFFKKEDTIESNSIQGNHSPDKSISRGMMYKLYKLKKRFNFSKKATRYRKPDGLIEV